MTEQIRETANYLKASGIEKPTIGIILGTGLGGLLDHVSVACELVYEDIPHFPTATVEFHKGKLVYGELEGIQVLIMAGRFHYYEGYSMQEIVYPIRVMHQLGIGRLLISNAAGNMNLQWKKGELMLIDDHINLQPDNPLRDKSAGTFGPIFVDMARPYSPELNNLAKTIALNEQINLREGVYVAVSGPNLETRAEYRFLRNIGADAVGMSTVPEVIAANQVGMMVCAISVLTDNCDPDDLQPVDINDIIATAQTAEHSLITLIKGLLKALLS